MASAIGWYGPLIDLCMVNSHVGDLVQLLVLVHRSTPVQYKLSRGGEVIRTDILVGDDTRPFFSVSLWRKQLAAMATAGDVILLQNVKIGKFGPLVEARTVECSSLLRLVCSYDSMLPKGVDKIMEQCRLGKAAIDKLGKVVRWLRRSGSPVSNIRSHNLEPSNTSCSFRFIVDGIRLKPIELLRCITGGTTLLACTSDSWHVTENNLLQQKRQIAKNWKVPEESESQRFFLLRDVSHLTSSRKAIFFASVGEIFLPITWRELGDSEKQKMFISRRIGKFEDESIAEDFICIGCKLCGSPFSSENGHIFKQTSVPLYCPKSPSHFHAVSSIYRPFMLYVWDESEYLPLLVRNTAAELLFGNIKAEGIYKCCKGKKHGHSFDQKISRIAGNGEMGSCSSGADKSLEVKAANNSDNMIDFHSIWLILLKMLLQQGKNSPLKFEVAVDAGIDCENGKFEMVSVQIPCIRSNSSLE